MSHTGDLSPYLSYDLSRTSDCSEKNPNIRDRLKPALRAAQLSKSKYIEAFQQSPNEESDELPVRSMAWMDWNRGAGREFRQGHLPHRDQSADVEAQCKWTTPPFIVKPKEKVVKDKFLGQEIKVMGGPYKGYFATVVATSPDNNALVIRLEGQATGTYDTIKISDATERHTGLALIETLTTNPDILHTPRASRASASDPLPPPLTDLPDVRDAWPEVADNEPPSPTLMLPLAMQPPPPGDWLRQPRLRDAWLDVIILNAENVHRGKYQNKVGVIRGVPTEILPGKRGVVWVLIGNVAATHIRLKVQNIFPLTTTEFDGSISKADAKPIMSVLGTQVIIIGGDMTGDKMWIGNRGFVAPHGAINIRGHIIHFPESSICRSDPFPRP
ncbi:hypothetical protein B0H10DRAFT_1950978 [Mycena sp. CBHHK59/15]|nr:hypothetical protein B0H10DRAFT_1950978 [Mycena sp. CBHHK59/15]